MLDGGGVSVLRRLTGNQGFQKCFAIAKADVDSTPAISDCCIKGSINVDMSPF